MRLVYIAIGWVLGLIIADNMPTLIPLFWIVLLAVAVTVAVLLWQSPRRSITLALVAFALAGFRYGLVPQTSDLAQYNTIGTATITGEVVAEPDLRDDRVQLRVATDTIFFGQGVIETSGLLLVNAPRFVDVEYGNTITARGRITTPAEFDTFSYSDFLARDGIFSVMSNANIEVTERGGGSPFYRALFDAKAALQANISRALPEPEAALLSGILLGNERGIDPKLSEAFSRVGASHIIAISGFNMVIVTQIIMGIAAHLTENKRTQVLLGTVVVVIYTLFVGANPAVVRAAIMSLMLVIAPLFRRRTYVPASLAFVLLVMTFQNPLVLWSISFQLSFFAVLGLALFTDPLSRWFDAFLHRAIPGRSARFVADILNEPIIVTIASLTLTLPLTIVYFQRLSLVVLLVNLIIVPVQSALLIVGGLATLLSPIAPPIAQILFWMDMLLLNWSIEVVRFFGELSFADVVFVVDPRLIAFFFIFVIGGAIVSATRPTWAQRLALFVRQSPVFNALWLSGLAMGTLMLLIGLSRPDGELHVWWLDVGHSNAVLLQTPSGAQMLVDGGRFPSRLLTNIGDRLPFYDRTLEIVAITQPDEFDTSALPAVLSRYEAGVVLTTGQPNESDAFALLQTAIAPFEVVEVRAGYEIELDDGTLIEVLHPSEKPLLGDNMGDVPMVLRVTYGDVSFLLPGDLSLSGQGELLSNGEWPLATVMQLPQHGTTRSLSTRFLEIVQPQVVILQSDVGNFRGDPAIETLSLVNDLPLFRTDEGGTLHLRTDGRTLWVVPEG